MASNFLDTLSAHERRHIRDRTDVLVGLLEEWTQRYPVIRATRVPTAALVTALALIHLPVHDALLSAQILLWIFGFDDQVDEHMLTFAEMCDKAELWHSIANDGASGSVEEGDDLTAILVDVRRELAKFHLFEPLRRYWASRLRILAEAMIREYQYGLLYNMYGPHVLPSLDEYLQGGLNSIGFPLWGTTVLILLRDPSVLERFESVCQAMECAGAAGRLYNDVRSLDREIRERSINSAFIIRRDMMGEDPTMTEERGLLEARQRVLQLADYYARKSYDLAEQLETSTGQMEEAICNVIAFHKYFYGYSEHDYHTTSLAKVHGMFNNSAPESLLGR